jgi:iron-sulfur cluster repair protein YtfE (RIC family)
MRESLDVLEILTSQHEEVDELFEMLENGVDDRAEVFAELADKLAAHAMVEEQLFYPKAMSGATSELLHESVEEHLSIKRLLADLLALDAGADKDDFDAKLSVLKEQVSHHAHEEEEQKLFPILRKAWNADERAAIGNELLARFEALVAKEPRRQIPNEIAEAASLPS